MPANWPDLTALELLVGIDDFGSLGLASRAAGLAQPNASRAIRNLERQLGATLVQRSPRGSTLTADGAMVAHWARQVLADTRELMAVAEALKVNAEAQLTIAASLTVAEYLLPGWLARYRRHAHDVHIHLQMLNSTQVVERVRDGACDVGFVESPSVPKGLHKMAVAHDRLVVVVEPGHPWALRRSPVAIAELASTPLIEREQGSGTRDTLDAALHDFSRPPPALELSSSAAIRASVVAGVGPAVLSSLAVESELRSGALCAVDVAGLEIRRTLWAVWRPPRRLSGPAGQLIAAVTRDQGAAHPDQR